MFNVNKENYESKLGYNVISDADPLSVITEQYRKLRTNIEFSDFNKSYKLLNVTSTFKGEGKSVTVLNLGAVYAQSNMKTLIIDMDIRRPKVHRAFKLSNATGLTNIVTEGLSVDSVIQTVNENLDVLTAGKKLPYPSEFLMSKQLKEIIESLKEKYDKIIVDTPPITAVADANIVSNLMDGTIMVVGSRVTNLDDAKAAIKQLKDNGGNIIGGVLTRIRKKDNNYANYYYAYKE